MWGRWLSLFLILFSLSLAASEDLNENLKNHIKYSETKENLIGHLSIEKDRPIDRSTYVYCKMALDEFAKKKVSFVILRLNTPGGEIFAAEKISTLLRDFDTHHKIPVIAFIDNWAVSAGAMLAYACRYIAITNTSLMGAAEPVLIKNGQMESASEKIKSALRAEFSNLASFYGRNPLIAEAMVDQDLSLVWRNNQVVKLSEDDDLNDHDIVITQEGKLLTLNADQLIEFKVVDFEVPQVALTPITEKEAQEGSWTASKSDLFQQPFLAKIPNAKIITYKDWKVSFFSFLSHPLIASLLFIGLLVGFYVEVNTPGFGIPGAIALACLSMIVLSNFSIHAIHWLEVIILLVGLVLLMVELFVIPGFGLTGILGILLMVAGLMTLMVPSLKGIHFSFDTNQWNLSAYMAFEKLAWLCGALVVAILFMIFLTKVVLPKISHLHPLVLQGEQEGYLSGPDVSKYPSLKSEGVAMTPLYPFGKIIIEKEIYEAKSERGFIDKGDKIIIERIDGNKIIVRKL